MGSIPDILGSMVMLCAADVTRLFVFLSFCIGSEHPINHLDPRRLQSCWHCGPPTEPSAATRRVRQQVPSSQCSQLPVLTFGHGFAWTLVATGGHSVYFGIETPTLSC